MKILFLSNGFPPEQWAGTETYTAGLARGLLARGHDVQVLCGGEWETGAAHWNGVRDESYYGVPVRRVDLNWVKAPDSARSLYNDPDIAGYLRAYLGESRPDLVHVTSCERLSASVLPVVKMTGLPLVLSLTDFWFLCPRMSLLRSDGTNCSGQTTEWECLACQLRHTRAYRWTMALLRERVGALALTSISRYPLLTRQRGLRGMAADMADRKQFLRECLDLPDVRLTASRFVRDVFLANGVEAPIQLHPYGHDLSWLDGYRGKSETDVVRVGYIGQIDGRKGVHLLMEAAGRLLPELSGRFQLIIYGNVDKQPAYGARLRAMAAEMPNVTFAGTYARADSGAVFAGIDVLIVPSRWYDFPLIIHEAFAAQTPVVATNLAGMAEAVTHDVDGLLFSRDDVADLAAQLRRIIVEPQLLPRLRAGIGPVKRLDQELDEIEALYRQLLPDHRTTPDLPERSNRHE